MTHQQLLNVLAEAGAPMGTPEIVSALGAVPSVETNAVVEILATLSDSVRAQGMGWVHSASTPLRRVLTALRAYSEANPHKSIFRAAAALGELPADEQPTEDQLRDLLSSAAEFKLLPNAMIKRVTS